MRNQRQRHRSEGRGLGSARAVEGAACFRGFQLPTMRIAECNHGIQLKRKNNVAFHGKERLFRKSEEIHGESS